MKARSNPAEKSPPKSARNLSFSPPASYPKSKVISINYHVIMIINTGLKRLNKKWFWSHCVVSPSMTALWRSPPLLQLYTEQWLPTSVCAEPTALHPLHYRLTCSLQQQVWQVQYPIGWCFYCYLFKMLQLGVASNFVEHLMFSG